MSKHGLVRLTMARTWGKPFSLLGHRVSTEMSFCLEIHNFFEIGTPMTLEAHIFLCRPQIGMRFKAKL
jgi:hypothetical protein